MASLSDTLLDSGCALHIEAAHGESIKVLSGVEAGKTFTAVRETEMDAILTTDLGMDPRAKRIIRFRDSGTVPRLGGQDIVQTDDGRKWHAVQNPQAGYLTTDFELVEIIGKDT